MCRMQSWLKFLIQGCDSLGTIVSIVGVLFLRSSIGYYSGNSAWFSVWPATYSDFLPRDAYWLRRGWGVQSISIERIEDYNLCS
jgi:hypothetical protein